MLGTHKPRINCIFCWSILTSLPILTSICVRLQWKCHLMVNHVTSDSIGQWHHPHGSNTGLTVLCYALHWIVKYSQMGVSLILRSLHKNVTKIAACYMWQFFSVANHHVESWICRGQKNLITHHSRQFDRSAIHEYWYCSTCRCNICLPAEFNFQNTVYW